MYAIIAPENINGNIKLPSSKSICNRALIINALSGSPYPIENLSDCDDTRAVVEALNSNGNHFDVGAAGTAMRFLTAFLSKIVGEWTITGSERMKQRPIKILVDALNSLGARIEYIEKEGFPPLRIFGSALQGGEIELDGSVSSQYLSALLMVAPTMQHGLTIHLKDKIASKPYIFLTLKMMEDFGVKSTWSSGKFSVPAKEYKQIPFRVESDWSAAAYWYEILALYGEGEIFLEGLHKKSYQGDSAVAELFEPLGVKTRYEKNGVRLTTTEIRAESMIYNFTDQPDLVQTFAVTCCLLNIPFSFRGLETLKIKETDRVAALIAEMRKIGYTLNETEEGALEWNGTKTTADQNPTIKTYEDHRMAMSFTPVALKISGLKISDPKVVSKSYPCFWDDLRNVGFGIDFEK